MVNALILEVLHELTGCKGWAIVSADAAGQSIHAYEFFSLWERKRADLEFTLNRKGYLAE